MASVVAADSLTKFYGTARGIEDVSFEVAEGHVFGFIGPNGAGKSTTIRLLLDMIRPTRGSSSILGLDSRSDSVGDPPACRLRAGRIGDVREDDRPRAAPLSALCGGLDGLGIAAGIADRLSLDLDQKIRSYSTGNRQKVALVQAFMHEPEVLILDEPTSGLDPLVQQEFYRLVIELKSEGRTVFLSSHILPEVERVADRVGIIRQGSLVVVEEIAAFKRKAVRKLEMRFGSPVPEERFSALDTVRTTDTADGGTVVTLTVAGSVDPVIKARRRLRVDQPS